MSHTLKSVFVACAVLVEVGTAQPAETPDEDKTLSPFFFVQSDDPTVDKLPLLKTSAAVDIAGVIADVKVTQVYKNDGRRPIEAIYTFPASTRAAVYAMKLTIGDRVIVARIKEREQARADYEKAKQQGKSASLLEQQRPNVFQMNVANIMPGDYIKVEMSYTELLVPTEGVYEFAYPTVVGPRYNNKTAKESPESEKWIASPYTREGEAPSYEFGMEANIRAGMPIQDVTCPSHKTKVTFEGLNSAAVRLDPGEKAGGNRDFILRYRLAGGRIESGLLLYPGKEENFFLLMLQPPRRVETAQIPSREYIFIMDVSGSMHGYPIDISKKLLRNLLSNLRPKDYFNVLFFSMGDFVLSGKSLPATEKNIETALEAIDEQQGGGGTELLSALQRALALPRAEGTSRSVVIATDGYVAVETEAFDLIRNNLGKANMFAFGIGTSVNRFIIEGMAHVGMGEPFIIEKPEAAEQEAEKFRRYIQTPVLTGITAEFHGFDAYDVEPPSIPDVLAERPIIVFGKWRGKPEGAITVRGWTASGKYSETVNVAGYAPEEKNAALRYLWARHRIQLLDDYNNLAMDDERKKEVTALGLKYSLLTRYTSFIAVDQKVRNVGGKQVVVEQPLPMPAGVSDYAIGGGAGEFARLPTASISGVVGLQAGAAVRKSYDASRHLELAKSQRAPTTGTVQLGRMQVTGKLSQKAVKEVIERKLGEIKADYTTALKSQPGLKGKVVVEFVIQADGTVRDVKVKLNEMTPALGQKLSSVIEKLTFSKPTSGEVTVSVPFMFTP